MKYETENSKTAGFGGQFVTKLISISLPLLTIKQKLESQISF